jgi:sec-independent protein translocase protein TatA
METTMGPGFWQIAIVVTLFLLLFGRGKLPALMSDLAEGIRNLRTGLSTDNDKGAVDSGRDV